jgi:hypothetical protein
MKINDMKKNTNHKNVSRFWLGDNFSVTSDRNDKQLDLTKLAAAQRAIGNFVSIVTGKQIPVVFKGYNSYTDGKSVVIGTKIEGDNFDPTVGLALHEGSHIALTDFEVLKNLDQYVAMHGLNPNLDLPDSELHIIKNLLNWVEDRRIDYASYLAAPGYRPYYEALYDKYFNDKVIDTALLTNEKSTEDWDCYMFHIINFTNANRNLDCLEKLKEVWKIVDLQNISRLKSTSDAMSIACEIYKLLTSHINSATGQKQIDLPQSSENLDNENYNTANLSDDGQSAEGEDATDTSDSENTANGISKSNQLKSATGQKQMSSAQQRRLETQIEKQKDFLNGNPKLEGRKLSNKDVKMLKAIKLSGTEIVTVTDFYKPIDTVVIRNINRNIINNFNRLFETRDFDTSKMQTTVNQGIILGKQLGKKLQVRNESRTLKSTRLATGKIDRRLINQLGAGVENIFHRLTTDQYKDYFLHISIDASSSMNGSKFHTAIMSAVAVAQAASMTNGIRVQITLRGTSAIAGAADKCVTIYAYDSAKDGMIKIKTLFKYLTTYGLTPEGLAFKSIEKNILKDAKQDECIFLNYSDGMPTNEVPGDPIEYTKKIINKFRDHGIQIISFYIESGSYHTSYVRTEFKRMYGESADFIDCTKMLDVAKSLNKRFLQQKQIA